MRFKVSLAAGLLGLAFIAAPAAAETSLPADTALAAELALPNGQVRTACRLWRSLAEAGDPEGQDEFGDCFLVGWGIPNDEAEALPWYRKSAAQGYAPAYISLALMYPSGKGVAADAAIAIDWFAKALAVWRPLAEAGDPQAQFELGRAYMNGWGVTEDVALGLDWCHKAAAQGDKSAAYALGQLYEHGSPSVPEDKAQAVKWIRVAAENGKVLAQGDLAMMYDSGSNGIPEDKVMAASWFEKAAQSGDAYKWLSLASTNDWNWQVKDEAEADLRRLTSMMTPEDIAEGQAKANAWHTTAEMELPKIQVRAATDRTE